MRIYISGPMSGIVEHNFPAFNETAALLRSLAYDVVNPAEINNGPFPDDLGEQDIWHLCLRRDVKALCDCTHLVLLPGWEVSQGANLELHIAHRLGLRVATLNDFLNRHYKERPHAAG